MSSLSEADSRCRPGDTICEIRVYEQEVIVVPVLFLFAFLIMLVFLLLLRFCPERVDRIRPPNVRSRNRPHRSRRNLQGIDAPFGINPLEHENIALDVPPSYSTFVGPQQNLAFTVDEPAHANFNNSQPPSAMPAELPEQRMPESFKMISPLPLTFSMRAGDAVSLYRARMGHRDVILRILKDSASATEKQSFLGFASFLNGLGAHPFLPAILGVVSLRAPLILVVEELENRDLLGFLWKCRQDHVGNETPCDITEKRIFTMSNQVASALEYLHKRNILHGNIGARSVLVSRELTAKLWGLGNAYARKTQQAPVVEGPWLKKKKKVASPRGTGSEGGNSVQRCLVIWHLAV
ncbi:hypothetical protein GJAV_G00006630 [Gymnothorax javanicus]|nr:hypothetical protein GJAV_G00006630 [Gymnothorax javanicus]